MLIGHLVAMKWQYIEEIPGNRYSHVPSSWRAEEGTNIKKSWKYFTTVTKRPDFYEVKTFKEWNPLKTHRVLFKLPNLLISSKWYEIRKFCLQKPMWAEKLPNTIIASNLWNIAAKFCSSACYTLKTPCKKLKKKNYKINLMKDKTNATPLIFKI